MAQIFHRSMNTVAKASILSVLLLAALGGLAWDTTMRSPFVTKVGMSRVQPVPFSHKHHVGGLGIDCRYCHTGVEESRFAGIPPTRTCMTCHSQVWSDAPMLEPIRESYRTNESVEWVRVHDLPDFAYFNHSVHVAAGVGCQSCHGQVDQMPLMWNTASLQMEWCLDCHRNPEMHLRPKDEVFSMAWEPTEAEPQAALGARLVAEHGINKARLTNCSVCHR